MVSMVSVRNPSPDELGTVCTLPKSMDAQRHAVVHDIV